MDLMINQGISPDQFIKIILWMLPQIVLFSLPAACLMSVMLAFMRLGSDNEIIALNASGISLFQMLPSVIIFSLFTYITASLLSLYGIPWGNRAYKDYLVTITRSKTSLSIKERVFYKDIDNIVFYVNSYSTREKEMKDVFIVDKRNKQVTTTIVAESGEVIAGIKPNIINLHLKNGTSFINDRDLKNSSIMKFPTLDYQIDLGDTSSTIAARKKKPKEMFLHELRKRLKSGKVSTEEKNEIGIKLYEMFSIPLAIFILGIIGAYLGSHVKARGRSTGVIISLFVFMVYYVSLMASRYLCEMGILPPSIGVWTPVFLLLAISLFFLSRVRKNGVFGLFN